MLKAWRGLSPDALKEAKAQYRKEHPEDPQRRKETAKTYYRDNQEEIQKKNSEWTQANPDKLFRAQLFRLYEMTLEEWTELLIQQLGLCALCGVQMDGPNEPMVDHCHLTGKVRGLLCGGCNTGLGMFEDCIDLLKLAVKYLRESGQEG